MEGKSSQRKKNLKNNQLRKQEKEQKESGIKKWTKEDDNKMGNIVDPYYKLQEISWDEET